MRHTTHPDHLPEGAVIQYAGRECLLLRQERYHNPITGFADLRQHVRRVGSDGVAVGATVVTVLALDPAYEGAIGE